MSHTRIRLNYPIFPGIPFTSEPEPVSLGLFQEIDKLIGGPCEKANELIKCLGNTVLAYIPPLKRYFYQEVYDMAAETAANDLINRVFPIIGLGVGLGISLSNYAYDDTKPVESSPEGPAIYDFFDITRLTTAILIVCSLGTSRSIEMYDIKWCSSPRSYGITAISTGIGVAVGLALGKRLNDNHRRKAIIGSIAIGFIFKNILNYVPYYNSLAIACAKKLYHLPG